MNDNTNLELRRLIKWGSIVVIILGLFLLVETLNAFKTWRGSVSNANTISVIGEGEVSATPDVANVTFSVSADAPTAGEAQNQVTSKMNAILSAIKNLGVADNDIKTSNYNVYPKYTYEPQVCTKNYCPPSKQVQDGFTASHDVSVKIRKTDDSGKILAAIGEGGATNISGLNFTTDDPTILTNQARTKAISNARSNADALAKSLGVRLGRVVTFYDNNTNYPVPLYARESASDGKGGGVVAPTLPIGENKVTSSVTVVYEIR